MSRIGLGLLALALVLGACWITPGSAWAQDVGEAAADAVEAVQEAAAEAEEAAEEISAELQAAFDEAKAAAEEAGDYDVAIDDGELVIVDTPKFTIDNLWVLIAGCLVFIMHLGFAMVESGLTRAKNTVNILFKNSMIICIGFLMYGVMGFNLHYPLNEGNLIGSWVGFAGFGFLTMGSEVLNDPAFATASGYELDMTGYTDFFFQAMFCATGATIISGAVAGRIKLLPFLLFTTFFTGIVYPLIGSWHWGALWLNNEDFGVSQITGNTFYDFAGSTVVHSVGGWGALIGAIVLGPRLGKYAADGTVQPIPGHNMPLVTIGVFLLWFGWFGFNGGSVLSADAGYVSLVLCTTTFAAAAGGLSTAIVSWVIGGKPDLSMALNGILAGLVGITAGADQMAMWEAVFIGLIAGVLVYFSVLTFDKLKIDDPVGAVSVHLVCGIWGTLVVGLLGDSAGGAQFMTQLIGVIVVGIATVIFALVGFLVLKFTIGIRVSEEEEIEGLDLGEHDMSAYPDFQRTYIKSYHAREI